MIASQARLKSQLTEKGATLPSATIRTKQATGSTEVQQLPRLRDYAPGTDRMALWQRDVRKAASGVSKGKRAQGTSDEHDRHMWALNEYAKRRASTRGGTLLTGKLYFRTTTTPRTRRNGSSRGEVQAEARRCSRRVRQKDVVKPTRPVTSSTGRHQPPQVFVACKYAASARA